MKTVTTIRLLPVTLGLMLMVCFVNLTVSQAQTISYSGDAYDFARRQNNVFSYGNRLILPPSGESAAYSDFFTITPFGCIGNEECLIRLGAPKGITLMVNGANDQSQSVAKVDFLKNLDFYGVTIAADWLISMTNASCPVGGSPLASSSSQLQYLFINEQISIPSPYVLTGYQSWIRTGTNGERILIEANVVNNTSSGNTGDISACALVLTNQFNGDQLRLGCSHADVVCVSEEPGPGACDSACTYTQGYYKNHENTVEAILAANPNTAFTQVIGGQVRLRLGNNYYTAAQLDTILGTPVGRGESANGLIQLAHQLITAELNLLKNNASCTPDSVETAIAASNTMIGSRVVPPVGGGRLSTSQTSSLNNTLDNFNNGNAGIDHCD
jgi:hypothetical protein